MHDPAHPLCDQVEAAAPRVRPVIAEAGELRVDQARVDLAQCVVSEPGARHHGRPIILDQHVHILDKPQEKRPPRFKGWDDPEDRYRLPTLDTAGE